MGRIINQGLKFGLRKQQQQQKFIKKNPHSHRHRRVHRRTRVWFGRHVCERGGWV